MMVAAAAIGSSTVCPPVVHIWNGKRKTPASRVERKWHRATSTCAFRGEYMKRSQVLRQGAMVLVGTQLCGTSKEASAQHADNAVPDPGTNQVSMRTLSDCALSVSIYPQLGYNASAGGGVASATPSTSGGPSRLDVTFDPQAVNIPDVTWRTATFLGVPLPPIFKIRVQPESLKGWIDRDTGEVQLDFVANFFFTAPLYKASPLYVETRLTTGSVQGKRLGGTGTRMSSDGRAKLVGVALVQPTGDKLLDTFLRLPDDTLAIMSSQFIFPTAAPAGAGSAPAAEAALQT